mgnify:CR=1 FL=1
MTNLAHVPVHSMKKACSDAEWKAAKPLGAFGIQPWNQSKVVWEEMFLPPVQYLRKTFTVDPTPS